MLNQEMDNIFFYLFLSKLQKMERQEYLQFFLNNKKKPSSKTIYNRHNISIQSRSLHANSHKNDKKLLPHILEEYQYKITNQLLVQKIMNPKRDKLIVQNFQKSLTRPSTRQIKSRGKNFFSVSNQVRSLDRKQVKQQQEQSASMSLYSRIKLKQNMLKLKQKGIKSYQKQFNLALENDRMGKRIVNTKSSVEQILKKTFYTYKSHNISKDFDKQNQGPQIKMNSFIRGRSDKKYYFSGKINNGVKVFFNEIKEDEKDSASCSRSLSESKLAQNFNKVKNEGKYKSRFQITQHSDENQTKYERKIKTSGNFRTHLINCNNFQPEEKQLIETHYPESFKIFGKGPTILMIHELKIVCNPPLKQNSMLLFELITHERRINFRKSKQKTIRTVPICYDFFKQASDQAVTNCLRFAINVSQIGDFVPLRIYRVHGVQMQQLGIIDIDLSAFRYRKSELPDKESNKFLKEQKSNHRGQILQRDIISGETQGQLRKNLLNKPVDISVSLSYKVYPRRYKNVSRGQM